MADNYRPGDHYVICDRTGFKIRASEAKREWTGALVRQQSWEARHPQDFVKAKADKQAALPQRARQIDRFVGPLITTVATRAEPGEVVLVVETTDRFAPGDRVALLDDGGSTFFAIVQAIASSTQLVFLPFAAAVPAGSQVTNYTAVSENCPC
jgi:hypothetical protein